MLSHPISLARENIAYDIRAKDYNHKTRKKIRTPLNLWMENIDLDSQNTPSLHPEFISKMSRSHKAGRDDNRAGLWSWHVLKIGIFI